MPVKKTATPSKDEDVLQGIPDAPQDSITVKDIIHHGDDKFPVDVVVSTMENAGLTFIYNAKTGDRSISPRNPEILREVLSRTNEDGERIFTLRDPGISQYRGTIKCLLHSENENRKHYDEVGLPTCRKENIPSQYQLELHMRSRHPTAWQTIERERLAAEATNLRDFQRKLMERMSNPITKE